MPPTNADRLREMAKVVQEEASKYKLYNCNQRFDYLTADAAALLAGAEALEAWEWMAENQISPDCRMRSICEQSATVQWRMLSRYRDGHIKYYDADTPLGAVRAAMEGEKEKKDE